MKRCFVLLSGAVLVFSISGCGTSDKPGPAAKSPPAAKDSAKTSAAKEHAHTHGAGPHDGTLTDWGGGAYHVEFTVDHEKKEATVYILGADEKTPAPIKAKSIQLVINEPMTELELTAKPLDGEAEGTSSRFVGTHDTLGIVREFAGTISGVVDGTPYTRDFQEEPHDAAHKK